MLAHGHSSTGMLARAWGGGWGWETVGGGRVRAGRIAKQSPPRPRWARRSLATLGRRRVPVCTMGAEGGRCVRAWAGAGRTGKRTIPVSGRSPSRTASWTLRMRTALLYSELCTCAPQSAAAEGEQQMPKTEEACWPQVPKQPSAARQLDQRWRRGGANGCHSSDSSPELAFLRQLQSEVGPDDHLAVHSSY